MNEKEIFQRIAYLLWDDAQLTREAEEFCKEQGFDPCEYMKKLEERKSEDKLGFIQT